MIISSFSNSSSDDVILSVKLLKVFLNISGNNSAGPFRILGLQLENRANKIRRLEILNGDYNPCPMISEVGWGGIESKVYSHLNN